MNIESSPQRAPGIHSTCESALVWMLHRRNLSESEHFLLF